MKILDKVIILASLPEILKLVGSSFEEILKIFGIDVGGDL